MTRKSALHLIRDHGRDVAEFVSVHGDHEAYRADIVLSFVGF